MIRLLSFFAALAISFTAAQAADNMSKDHMSPSAGPIHIENAWARANAAASRPAAAFVTIRNTGPADELVSASSPVAEVTEIHETTMENGVMKMHPVAPLAIPAGGTIEMKPGSYHIMLIKLKERVAAGDTIKLGLTFRDAGMVMLDVPVAKPGALSAEPGNHDHKSHMMNEMKH